MTTPDRRPATVVFADQNVGLAVVRYLLDTHPRHLVAVVTIDDNEITREARAAGCRTLLVNEITESSALKLFGKVDVIFLAWWPKIIRQYLIDVPRIGVVNFHPSLLPYNRGKHYNFWTLVEGTPFGVTLHFVDAGVDSGDILFQTTIGKTWEDTGGTLYSKAAAAMVALFKHTYLDIVEGRYDRTPQGPAASPVHYARELDPASRIELDKAYEARHLLNLLRARTFDGKPSCYFEEEGKMYEVRISVKEISDASR